MNITDISGIGDTTAQQMKAHGFDSVEAVAQATVEQLVAVPGIGAARAAALNRSARQLLADTDAGALSPEGVALSGDAATNGRKDEKKDRKKDRKKRKEKRKKEKRDKKDKKDKKKDKGGKKKKNKRK